MDRDSDPLQPVPTQPPGANFPGSGTELVGLHAGDASQREIFGMPILAELPAVELVRQPSPTKSRRVFLPVGLFIATCMSTLFVGIITFTLNDEAVANDWLMSNPFWRGPIYMAAIMSFLFAHEMGHFLQSLRYRVPASLPYFIPIPFPPIGTMGAVILMRGQNRNRKELFDVGLSGPWAGLLVALPMVYYGIVTATATDPNDFQVRVENGYFPDCLLIEWLIAWLRPDVQPHQELLLSPWLLAGWGATLLTGLNMMPVGQFDGGHVAYSLFGRRAHWLARFVMLVAGLYIIVFRDYGWSVMYILALLMRPAHPPTLNDAAPLGWPRWLFGFASLSIPVFCLAPFPRM